VSNWRSQKSLSEYLKENGIPGIEGVDTRRLTEVLRNEGAMRAGISTIESDPKLLLGKVRNSPSMIGQDLAKLVSCQKAYEWEEELHPLEQETLKKMGDRKRVVAYDFGIKQNILRSLVWSGCCVRVVPAVTPAEEVLAEKPDGILLSNGPGDPEAVTYGIEATRKLLGNVPIFGICLGHQILGLALGGKTYKLKFGHHGANHPVMDVRTKKVAITAQNHGFAVDIDSIPDKQIELTHINLNDHTVEGMRHKKLPIVSVQYHPEASPGPHDARYLFEEFVAMMD
jgi:carbamoyl-phosphate synthase small subunit